MELESLYGQARQERHTTRGRAEAEGSPPYRYGLVFALMLALVVFMVAAPNAGWTRAVAVLLSGAALVIAVMTARTSRDIRRSVAVTIVILTAAVVGVTASATAPGALTALFAIAVIGAVPRAMVRGLLSLLRTQGITMQAVAGALVIYLSMGVIFAWIITFIAEVSSTPYFAQHTNGTLGDRVYFSFTTLTTTGYGDFSAGTPTGHAIAVVEMLTGQLYIATVIGLLIGGYVSRLRARSSGDGR